MHFFLNKLESTNTEYLVVWLFSVFNYLACLSSTKMMDFQLWVSVRKFEIDRVEAPFSPSPKKSLKNILERAGLTLHKLVYSQEIDNL